MENVQTSLDDLETEAPRNFLLSVQDYEPLYQCSVLLRIFQAYILAPSVDRLELVTIKLLLDVSWNDLRAALCRLRPKIGEDKVKIRALAQFAAKYLSPESTISTLSLKLARGFIHLLKEIETDEKPHVFW
jgi:hypothetical protein